MEQCAQPSFVQVKGRREVRGSPEACRSGVLLACVGKMAWSLYGISAASPLLPWEIGRCRPASLPEETGSVCVHARKPRRSSWLFEVDRGRNAGRQKAAQDFGRRPCPWSVREATPWTRRARDQGPLEIWTARVSEPFRRWRRQTCGDVKQTSCVRARSSQIGKERASGVFVVPAREAEGVPGAGTRPERVPDSSNGGEWQEESGGQESRSWHELAHDGESCGVEGSPLWGLVANVASDEAAQGTWVAHDTAVGVAPSAWRSRITRHGQVGNQNRP